MICGSGDRDDDDVDRWCWRAVRRAASRGDAAPRQETMLRCARPRPKMRRSSTAAALRQRAAGALAAAFAPGCGCRRAGKRRQIGGSAAAGEPSDVVLARDCGLRRRNADAGLDGHRRPRAATGTCPPSGGPHRAGDHLASWRRTTSNPPPRPTSRAVLPGAARAPAAAERWTPADAGTRWPAEALGLGHRCRRAVTSSPRLVAAPRTLGDGAAAGGSAGASVPRS